MLVPLFNARPHPIVNLVFKYIETINSPNTKEKISFNKVKNKICRELIAPLLGIDAWFNKNPNKQWLDGVMKKKFLMDTLEWCRVKLNLNKSAINGWIRMVMEGIEIRNEKIKKHGIRHAPYRN